MIGLETRFHYSPYKKSWRPVRCGIESLSPREHEVVCLIASAWPAEQIASKFNVSKKTVWQHRIRAMRKLGVSDTTTLVHLLLARGAMRNLYADEPNG